jgi:TonB family protein
VIEPEASAGPYIHYVRIMRLMVLFGPALAVFGCGDAAGGKAAKFAGFGGANRPDEPPVVVSGEMPFRYPPTLYARKVQGNVTLRLFIDGDGRTVPDSTRVEVSSGFESLDSAAVRGSQELRFVPAKRRGEPMPVSVLFPIYFRHPEAGPLPGDTVLGKTDLAASRGVTSSSAGQPAAVRKP